MIRILLNAMKIFPINANNMNDDATRSKDYIWCAQQPNNDDKIKRTKLHIVPTKKKTQRSRLL